MPPRSPLTARRLSALQRALGVTRIARVSGLDRSGVEVACAVRPGGHVLQVCNGKGLSWPQAQAGALLEAAELWAAERVDPTALVFGSLDELRASFGDAVWDPSDLGSAGRLVAPALFTPRTRLAFHPARDLFSGRSILLPAQSLFCPPQGAAALGPALVSWTSNGSGAHPDAPSALLHALLEAVERDQLARALPSGWTDAEVRRRKLDLATLPRGASALTRAIGARGFDVHLFDLAPALGDLRLPVAGALLVDPHHGPIPLTAGYACALDSDAALVGALLEAAQSRLTDIHGARDDVSAAHPEHARRLAALCSRAPARRDAARMPKQLARSAAQGVLRGLDALGRAGFRRAAAVDLAPPTLGIHIYKVAVPGLLVSELL